nr:hypothetical protein [Chelativorans petroleitrophicus]
MLSYLFSTGLNALLREAGFGTVPNAIIMMFGFFGAIYAGNFVGMRFSLIEGVFVGLAGAFVLLLALVLLKAALDRMA